MHEMTISIGTISKVKQFVDIVSDYKEQLNLTEGNYEVDAKSIMGIFSMDLTVPHLLKVQASDQRFREIQNDLREYMVA